MLIDGKSVDIVAETIVTKPFCRLLHFKKDLHARRLSALKQPKVLLVAPMSGHLPRYDYVYYVSDFIR